MVISSVFKNLWLQVVSIVVFTVELTLGSSCVQASEQKSNVSRSEYEKALRIRPLWVVTSFKLIDNTIENEDSAKKLLFTPLEITENAVYFGEEKCLGVKITEEEMDAKTFARMNAITLQALGVADLALIEIKTNCLVKGMSAIYRLNDRRMLMKFNNAWLILSPNIN